MRYKKIDPNLFINNRKKLTKYLKPNSLVILNANDVMPTNTDGVMPFFQNSDLFYLSGIDQAATLLVLYPDAPNPQQRELLFIKETSAHHKIWEGATHDKVSAASISGISQIHWLGELEQFLHTLMGQAHHIYLNTNEHARAAINVTTRDGRFIHWCQNNYPLHAYERLAPIMQQLRVVKSPLEIALMQQACTITEEGFRRVVPTIQPGMVEYEIEGAFAYEFIRRGASGFAYAPIVASGPSTCTLHYTSNNQTCQDGDLLLLDIGANYANYHTDLTRVLPISGKFTKRQRAVYNAVLRVMDTAKQLLVPGHTLPKYHKEIGKIMENELVGLGLLDAKTIKNQDPNNPAYKRYFMHGTSHHIGLSTHDLGDIYQPLACNMVLTIEPGIYIPEERIGIRLENNVVIRENGVEDLTAHIPILAEEIESLMQGRCN